MKKMSAVTLSAGLLLSLPAQNLIPSGENPWNSPKVQTVEVEGRTVFALTGPAIQIMSKPIPVDPSKRYRLSGKLRSAPGKELSVSCFGLAMQDARGLNLTQSNVNAVEGSETALAEAAAKGAQKIIVRDGGKWEKRRSIRSVVAFNVKENYGDLPNFALSGLIERIKKSTGGEDWEVTLKTPLAKDYPAGTAVRQHLYGMLLNCCLAYQKVPEKWTSYTAEIGGSAKTGAPPDQFWNGAGTVKVLIMADAARNGAELQFTDIVFEEIK